MSEFDPDLARALDLSMAFSAKPLTSNTTLSSAPTASHSSAVPTVPSSSSSADVPSVNATASPAADQLFFCANTGVRLLVGRHYDVENAKIRSVRKEDDVYVVTLEPGAAFHCSFHAGDCVIQSGQVATVQDKNYSETRRCVESWRVGAKDFSAESQNTWREYAKLQFASDKEIEAAQTKLEAEEKQLRMNQFRILLAKTTSKDELKNLASEVIAALTHQEQPSHSLSTTAAASARLQK